MPGKSGSASSVGQKPLPPRLGMLVQMRRLLRHLPAALIVALISMSYAVSYGAMIFGSGGALLLQAGLPLLFLTTCVVMLMSAWSSSLPFVVGGADSNSVGLLSLMVSGIWSVMTNVGTPPQEALVTVLMAVALSSVIVGILLTALGAMRRGSLVQFIPFPVIGGFLAGTGYLLWTGAFVILTGHTVSPDRLSALLYLPWQVLLPALIMVLAMLGLPGKKLDHPAVLPVALVLACLVFFAGLAQSGTSIEQARALGWMFAPLSLKGFQTPVTLSWHLVHWDILLHHYSEILALVAVTTLTILLNATGVGLATRREVDFNHELRTAGVTNIVTGLLGGVVGCQSLSRTLLNYRFGSRNRVAALLAAGICLLCALFFLPLVAYLPKPVLGGLLIGLGGALLNEWVLKTRHRLARGDYFLIVLILAVIAWYGFVTGVALGIVVACVLFVVDYGRVSCVKMEFTGTALHSKLERPMDASARLKQCGERVFGMRLQGFLFFGSANQMVSRVREQLQLPREYIIIDFRHVQGLDASTSQSFAKLAQVCEQYRTTLILTGIDDRIRLPITRAAFDGPAPQEFADLDAALEWVEDRMLAGSAADLSGHDLRTSLLDHFDVRELGSLFARMETVDLDAGTLLFRQGEMGDCMYFIEEGQVSISLALEDGTKMRLRSFGSGTIVGEMALYSGQKRTADVITDRRTRACKLSMARLRQLEREDAATALQLHSYVVKVMASRLAATNEAYRLAY
jgi:SulP family sulfate permease